MKAPAIAVSIAGIINLFVSACMFFTVITAPQLGWFAGAAAESQYAAAKTECLMWGTVLFVLSIGMFIGAFALFNKRTALAWVGCACTLIAGIIGGIFPGWSVIFPIGVWTLVALIMARKKPIQAAAAVDL